jgi:hypothetical protein
MKKNVGISISKCLKSAAKNRRANQTARAILSAPTVVSRLLSSFCKPILYMLFKVHIICELANIVRCVIYRLVVNNLHNMLSNFFVSCYESK